MAQSINNLAIGDKIKFGKYNVETDAKQDIIWQVAAKGHQGYPVNSITLLTEKIIDLRGFDAKEPSNSNTDRKSYGNNRYRDSNLRQWLNKGGSTWFQKTHTADEAPTDGGMNQPTGYDTKDGFLSAFTEEELAIILDTNLTVALNTVTDGGGSETVTDKVFLLSNTEVGLANENSIVEGGLLPLFTNDASRVAYLTQQAFSNTNSASKPANVSAAWYWWLRTPNASDSHFVRYVNTDGSLNDSYAYYGNFGVRPALNLKSDLLVSDTTDVDGCYEAVWTNVISNDLQKINDTDFTWNVSLIGEHTGVKSQLHVYDNSNVLVAQGVVKNGIGIQTDTIIPNASGNFKAKVKLWSDVTEENWSNEISYTITVIPYVLTLDKTINIQAGEKLEKLKFAAKVNTKKLTFKEIDNEKIIYEGEMLNADAVKLEIEGKDGKIDNIAYTII